jgi:hypothetical protein
MASGRRRVFVNPGATEADLDSELVDAALDKADDIIGRAGRVGGQIGKQ